MVMKKRVRKAVKKAIKKRVSKPFGIVRDGKRYRLAFGTPSNVRKGRKMFNSRKTILAFAKKKGFIK